MIVCHCRGVSDRRIRRAVREGACTRAEIARACGATRTCGGCAPMVDAILASESLPEAALAPGAAPGPAVAAS